MTPRDERIIALWHDGAIAREIGVIVGARPGYVRNRIRRLRQRGVVVHAHSRGRVPDQRIIAIATGFAFGLSGEEIGLTLKMSRSAFTTFVWRHSILSLALSITKQIAAHREGRKAREET